MNAHQKYESPHLAALAGGAAASIVAGGKPADALRALLGVGDLPHAECVPRVLDLAERAMGGQFGLTARLNRGAGELDRLVDLAHRAEPNGLDRATLLAAHQTVGLVTAQLFSLAELVALTQGAGRPILDLYMVRYRLLSGSGLLDGRATSHVRQRLDRADQASRLVEWPTPVSVRHQDIAARDRQVDALPNINLRLGLVLLGERSPMTAAALRVWFQQHRPDVLELAERQARVLGALGEAQLAGCHKVLQLLIRAIECAGAKRLSNDLWGENHGLFALAMEIQREA